MFLIYSAEWSVVGAGQWNVSPFLYMYKKERRMRRQKFTHTVARHFDPNPPPKNRNLFIKERHTSFCIGYSMYLCFGLSCASNTIFDFFDSTFVHIILILQHRPALALLCVFLWNFWTSAISRTLSLSFLFVYETNLLFSFIFVKSFFLSLSL